MRFELIEKNNRGPHRILAMLRTTAYMQQPFRRKDVTETVQPNATEAKTRESSNHAFNACTTLGWLRAVDERGEWFELAVPLEALHDATSFARFLQGSILGKTSPRDNNFLLNQFAAWYAVQNELVLLQDKYEIVQPFNATLYSNADTDVFSDHPMLTAWYDWAAFLGWGWTYIASNREKLMPDATMRLLPLLDTLLPVPELPIADFLNNLAQHCPELDGGVLFKQCWEMSRGTTPPPTLSLMLSTALRVLAQRGNIQLIDRPDAPKKQALYPSTSYPNYVTHIRREVTQ